MRIHSENRDLTQIVIGAAMKVLNTLNITGLHTALLLNFKHAKLGIKRISKTSTEEDADLLG